MAQINEIGGPPFRAGTLLWDQGMLCSSSNKDRATSETTARICIRASQPAQNQQAQKQPAQNVQKQPAQKQQVQTETGKGARRSARSSNKDGASLATNARICIQRHCRSTRVSFRRCTRPPPALPQGKHEALHQKMQMKGMLCFASQQLCRKRHRTVRKHSSSGHGLHHALWWK